MDSGFSTGLHCCLKTSIDTAVSSTGKVLKLIVNVVGPK